MEEACRQRANLDDLQTVYGRWIPSCAVERARLELYTIAPILQARKNEAHTSKGTHLLSKGARIRTQVSLAPKPVPFLASAMIGELLAILPNPHYVQQRVCGGVSGCALTGFLVSRPGPVCEGQRGLIRKRPVLRTQVIQVPSGLRRQQPCECSRPGLRPLSSSREHWVSIDWLREEHLARLGQRGISAWRTEGGLQSQRNRSRDRPVSKPLRAHKSCPRAMGLPAQGAIPPLRFREGGPFHAVRSLSAS